MAGGDALCSSPERRGVGMMDADDVPETCIPRPSGVAPESQHFLPVAPSVPVTD